MPSVSRGGRLGISEWARLITGVSPITIKSTVIRLGSINAPLPIPPITIVIATIIATMPIERSLMFGALLAARVARTTTINQSCHTSKNPSAHNASEVSVFARTPCLPLSSEIEIRELDARKIFHALFERIIGSTTKQVRNGRDISLGRR